VVHKILLPVGLTRKKFARWPLLCQKMIGHYELPVLGRNFIPISKVFTLKRWEHGNVESYRGLLWQLIEAVSIGPCLICVDSMITENGTPYFLEVNRLAGNFLIHFEGQQRNVFENYLHFL
jgi:hypothetical protein